MKLFKSIDNIIQLLLIAGAFILNLFSRGGLLDSVYFFPSYFVVGGWQVLSVIIHFFFRPPYPTTMRKIYLVALALVFVVTLGSIPLKGILMVLMGLLFVTPVMAIYYLVTCMVETKRLKQSMATGS